MNIPDEIRDLSLDLLDGLRTALGEKLFGIYLYGALAFPEGDATGDIDFHVILSDTLDEGQKGALKDLHAALAENYPPLGAELDGYYILLEEAQGTKPPRHQILNDIVDNSWALHRAHIRAGRCIILYGPDPRQIYPEASWSELESALQGELDYVEQHLSDYPDYCVLNLCRLMYSFKTRNVVVSKFGSATWAYKAFPEWRPHIEAARNSYQGRAASEEKELLKSELMAFFDFAIQHIEDSRKNSQDL